MESKPSTQETFTAKKRDFSGEKWTFYSCLTAMGQQSKAKDASREHTFANLRRPVYPINLCMRGTVLCMLAAVVLGGCQGGNQNSQPGAIQKLSTRDADGLNASHSRFESTEDPPINAQTHFAAGQFAQCQGRNDRAIEQYLAAIKLEPNNQPALYQLALLYSELKQFPQATETWKQYVRATGGSAAAYSNLAFCYELAGQIGQAEAAYQAGIGRDPASRSCRVNYGLMLARNNRRDEAVTQLSAVLQPAEVHYNLASVYEQMHRKDAARQEYKKALELDPCLWEAQVRLSKLDD